MSNVIHIPTEEAELLWAFFARGDEAETIEMRDLLHLWEKEGAFEALREEIRSAEIEEEWEEKKEKRRQYEERQKDKENRRALELSFLPRRSRNKKGVPKMKKKSLKELPRC
jgi:hypothetical protein